MLSPVLGMYPNASHTKPDTVSYWWPCQLEKKGNANEKTDIRINNQYEWVVEVTNPYNLIAQWVAKGHSVIMF